MSTDTLQGLVAGFDDEALGSQASFRAALHALSHPGQPVPMTAASGLPATGQRPAARLLLALLDADCTLWLSPTLAACIQTRGPRGRGVDACPRRSPSRAASSLPRLARRFSSRGASGSRPRVAS